MDPSLNTDTTLHNQAIKKEIAGLFSYLITPDLFNIVRKRVPDALQVLEFLAFAILNATGKRQRNILSLRVSSVQVTYVASSFNIVRTALTPYLPNHFLLVASPANHSRLSTSARRLP